MTLNRSPIEQWVIESPDNTQREFREAVHTILVAVANDPTLKADMIIKGGILLAVRYHSHRYTKDIDFSTSKVLNEIDPEKFVNSLNQGLVTTIEHLDYDLDCRVQSHKIFPTNRENPTFPELEITVGFAHKGSRKHKRLLAGNCTSVIKIDFSLNEPTPNIEYYEFGNEENLKVYSLTDLIAEKLRAFLQMGVRNRVRRQDIYDIFFLINTHRDIDSREKYKILQSLLIKAKARNIDINQESFRDEKLRERAARTYPELAQEVEGELPEFEEIYNVVLTFYENLPWEKV